MKSEKTAGEIVRRPVLIPDIVAVFPPGPVQNGDKLMVENVEKVPQGVGIVLVLGNVLGKIRGKGGARAVQAHEIERELSPRQLVPAGKGQAFHVARREGKVGVHAEAKGLVRFLHAQRAQIAANDIHSLGKGKTAGRLLQSAVDGSLSFPCMDGESDPGIHYKVCSPSLAGHM